LNAVSAARAGIARLKVNPDGSRANQRSQSGRQKVGEEQKAR
jgi:hypothetical protein